MSSVGILCFFCQEPHYICYSCPRAFLSVLLFKNVAPYSFFPLFSADCSAPSKGLYISGKWKNLLALLRCANRDAPTLLGYVLTYHRFIQRKDKSKMVRKPANLTTIARQAFYAAYTAQDISTANLPNLQ